MKRFQSGASGWLVSLVVLVASGAMVAVSAGDSDANGYPFGPAPNGFIENRGQVDQAVRYYALGSRAALFFTADAVVVDLKESAGVEALHDPLDGQPDGRRGSPPPHPDKGCAIYIRFEGANPSPTVEARGQLEARTNYFLGNDPAKWRTDVPAFAEVVYHDLWPGIDLVYRDDEGKITYELVTAPGANPEQVRFAYEGAERVTALDDGSFAIETEVAQLKDFRPTPAGERGTLVWGTEVSYASRGGLRGERSDPSALLWSTFLGGRLGWEDGSAVVVDSSGNPVVAGYTCSSDFPTTPGAYDRSLGGDFDAIVAKLNASGTALVWSTFLGGSATEEGYDLVLDPAGNPVVTGETSSSDFPATTGAYDRSLNGGVDAFVAKLDASGSTLLWGTFLGGTNDDEACGITIDSSGNPVVTGSTYSSDFPTTAGAYDRSINGSPDAFVAKLNASGSTLSWSTFLGGNAADTGSDIALDVSENPVVSGYTGSSNFPTTAGAYDGSYNGGGYDVFVAKLNASGSVLSWSTFLGGSGADVGWALALDSSGNCVLAGDTDSSNFPTTAGAYDQTFGGYYDGFVTKLGALGSTLLWSTFLGGTMGDFCLAVVVDSAGNAVVAGQTESSDFPTTLTGYDQSWNGSADAFVAKLNSSGTGLLWGTFLGGTGYDYAQGVALDPSGDAVITGATDSSDFPTTAGAYDTSYNGGDTDVFVAKLRLPQDIDFVPWQDLTGVSDGDAQWGDFDGDGDLDLVYCGDTGSGLITRTYTNQGGILSLKQSLTGIKDGWSSGCLGWGDYDNDGDLDLAMAGSSDSGPIARMYENDGTGTLTWDTSQVLTGVNDASVAWGDYDNDGDLDLLLKGAVGMTAVTYLYENNPVGTLTLNTSVSLIGLNAGSADWADIDGDGDLDLLLTGYDQSLQQQRTIFYKNDPVGTLTYDGDHGLVAVYASDAAWGDFDNDHDLDLAITGGAPGSRWTARIYRNDGTGAFTQVAEPATICRSSCAWGDYDNDGDLDVAFCGYGGSGAISTHLFKNTGSGFTQESFSFCGVCDGALTWADADNDGRLDLLVIGTDFQTRYARLYRKVGGLPDAAPTCPVRLGGTGWIYPPPLGGGVLRLWWVSGTDPETRPSGFYYCLRVGTTSGGNDVVSGTYATPLMGNVGQARGFMVRFPGMTMGRRFYYSVRTIDSGFRASPWYPEQSIVADDWIKLEMATLHPIDDAFVDSGSPNTPLGATLPNVLQVGNPTSQPGRMARAYLKYDLSTIQNNVVIHDAYLDLYRYGGSPPSTVYWIDAWKELDCNWNENTITWNNAPTSFGSSAESCRGTEDLHWGMWDVSRAVVEELPNDVITLVLRGNNPPEGTASWLAEFYAQEYANNPSLHPDLQVMWYSEGHSGAGVPTGEAATPLRWLEPNTPNPFQAGTTISYFVPGEGMLELTVFDAAGRAVRHLAASRQLPGRNTVAWSGDDDAGRRLPSGVYFCRLATRGVRETRRIVIQR